VLDQPDIAPEELREAVRAGWRLAVTGLRFVAAGLDQQVFGYEAAGTGGDRYFVKVRYSDPAPAGVLLPMALAAAGSGVGAERIVAPVPTRTGAPWHRAGRMRVLLHRYVDGESCWSSGLTGDQWEQYGRILAAVHAAVLPDDVRAALAEDTYASTAPARLRALDDWVAAGTVSSRVTELWRGYRDRLMRLADRTERFGADLAAAGLPQVPCHADAHSGNLVADADGRVWMIDWDTAIRAPRERDLMFVTGWATFGDIEVTDADRERFVRGYGPIDCDRRALVYYGHERIADDVAEFAADLVHDRGGPATQDSSTYWLRRILASDGFHRMLTVASVD